MPAELLPDENLALPRLGKHWIVLASAMVVPTLAAMAALVVVNVLAASLLSGGLRLLLTAVTLGALGGGQVVVWLRWTAPRFTITDRRIILEEGAVRRVTKVIALDDVRDVVTRQTLLGRMLGYGSIEIEEGRHGAELLTYVAWPESLRDWLFVLAERLRRNR